MGNDFLGNWENFKEIAVNGASRLAFSLLVFLIFLLLALAVRKTVKSAVARMSTQGHVDHIVAQLTYIGVLAVGAVVALSFSGLNIGALVTSLGLAGFAVGFAIKDILGNFLAGILILIQRPFTLGDEISLAGVEGRVESVRVRDTLVKTGDGTLVYIPNSIVFNGILTNKSAFDIKPVTLRWRCHRAAEPGVVIEKCLRLLQDSPSVLKDPKPQVFLDELVEDGFGYSAKLFIDSSGISVEAARSEALSAINSELSKEGFAFLDIDGPGQ